MGCAPSLGALAVLVLASTALAEPAAGDKSRYHLFDPTPRELRRPLSADRPDFTESPYTVDTGAIQLEMSFVDYARESDADAVVVAPFNLKLGVLNDVDVQLVFDPYIHEQEDDVESRDGPGDMQLRTKVNLWGNDGGRTALAAMPFLKIPTASHEVGNGRVEGGLIFPFALDLATRVGLGAMLEADAVFDESDDDYDAEIVTTGVVGYDATEAVGVYTEIVGIASSDADVDYRVQLGVGGTYAVTEDLMLDAGCNVGLTGEVDDVNPFVGMTVRF